MQYSNTLLFWCLTISYCLLKQICVIRFHHFLISHHFLSWSSGLPPIQVWWNLKNVNLLGILYAMCISGKLSVKNLAVCIPVSSKNLMSWSHHYFLMSLLIQSWLLYKCCGNKHLLSSSSKPTLEQIWVIFWKYWNLSDMTTHVVRVFLTSVQSPALQLCLFTLLLLMQRIKSGTVQYCRGSIKGTAQKLLWCWIFFLGTAIHLSIQEPRIWTLPVLPNVTQWRDYDNCLLTIEYIMRISVDLCPNNCSLPQVYYIVSCSRIEEDWHCFPVWARARKLPETLLPSILIEASLTRTTSPRRFRQSPLCGDSPD